MTVADPEGNPLIRFVEKHVPSTREYHGTKLWVRIDGTWSQAAAQKMDCALVLREGQPVCVKQRAVRAGLTVGEAGPWAGARPTSRGRVVAACRAR